MEGSRKSILPLLYFKIQKGKELNKYRLMPAPYRIADVIETIATYHMDFFWGQDLQPGFEPTSHHDYLTEEAGLNHSAILLS